MKNILQTIGLTIVLPLCLSLNAQNPIFYQFNGNPVYSNPAFTGLAHVGKINKARFTANYNGGFSGVLFPQRILHLSYDQNVDQLGGIGAQLIRDGNGVITRTEIVGNYGEQVRLTDDIMLSGGVQLGFNMVSLDPSNLKWGSQINPTQGFGSGSGSDSNMVTNISYFNASAGVLLASNNWLFGFSAFNINQPNKSFYRNQKAKAYVHFSGLLGYQFKTSEHISITPTFQMHVQSNFQTYLIGGLLNINQFQLSAQYQDYVDVFTNSARLNVGAGYQYKSVRLIYNISRYLDGNIPMDSQHELGLRWLWGSTGDGNHNKDILSLF